MLSSGSSADQLWSAATSSRLSSEGGSLPDKWLRSSSYRCVCVCRMRVCVAFVRVLHLVGVFA